MKKHTVRLIALLFTCIMVISLFAGCGTKPTGSAPSDSATSNSAPSSSAPSDSEPSGFNSDDVSQGDATGKDTITIALRTDAGTLDPANLTTETYAAVNCIQKHFGMLQKTMKLYIFLLRMLRLSVIQNG
jgi:hypothetical protein